MLCGDTLQQHLTLEGGRLNHALWGHTAATSHTGGREVEPCSVGTHCSNISHWREGGLTMLYGDTLQQHLTLEGGRLNHALWGHTAATSHTGGREVEPCSVGTHCSNISHWREGGLTKLCGDTLQQHLTLEGGRLNHALWGHTAATSHTGGREV